MKKTKALTKSILKVSILPTIKFVLEIAGIVVGISLFYYMLEYKWFIALFGMLLITFFGFGFYTIIKSAIENIIEDYRDQMEG